MQAFADLGYYAVLAAVFILMICVLVAAHELGHYWFARLFGMGVEEFAIGFGKKPLWVWMRRTYSVRDDHHPDAPERTETTDFTIRPWPLGGFVRIKGMVPEADGSEVNIPGGFYNKPPWQRLIVLFAGPAFSIIAGIAMLIPLYAVVGVERPSNEPVIPKIESAEARERLMKKPAFLAGLREGDRVVAVDGKPVRRFYDIVANVRDKGGQTVVIEVEREGIRKSFTVMPEWNEFDTQVLDEHLQPTGEWKRQAALGIPHPGEVSLVPLGLAGGVKAALNEPVRAVRSIVSLVQRPKNFGQTVSGPVTIVKFTDYALRRGFAKVVNLAALLSISVGIFNLFPFGMLDGGQMVVAFLEMLRRGRRLSLRVQEAMSMVGMFLLVLLVLGAWFFDFKRWFGSAEDTAKAPRIEQKKE